MVVGLGHRKYSWVSAFNKDLVLDQQFILSARWSACSQYIEFRSLRISELLCAHFNENAGKPWIRQSFFRQCFKITISPKFFTAKVLFYTVATRIETCTYQILGDSYNLQALSSALASLGRYSPGPSGYKFRRPLGFEV